MRRRNQLVPDERPQPYEIPWRQVGHDEEPDGLEGVDYIGGTGNASVTNWWGDQEAEAEWDKDIRRREKARRKLGGFGFR